jgi:hypothetical protein
MAMTPTAPILELADLLRESEASEITICRAGPRLDLRLFL